MADMDYNYSGDVVTGVEPAKKRKGAVIGGVTAGVLAVAVGGGIAAYNMSDLVKNQVKLTISKPDEYYSWVIEKNSNEMASQISQAYRNYLEEYKKGAGADLKLGFELSEDAKTMLTESSDGEIPEINNVAIVMSSVLNENILNTNISAEVNDKTVITAEMAADYNAYDIFMRLPELSEQWILCSSVLDETMLEEGNLQLTNYEDIITPDELESLIVKYSNLFTECVSDVTIEKKEEISIGDINVNYTVAEMSIDNKKGTEIAEKFINEVKNDELIKKIVVERTKMATADEYVEDLDYVLENLKESSDSSDEAVIIKTYIDPTGAVRGISAIEDETKGESMRLIFGMQESEIRGECVLNDYSVEGDAETRMDITLSEEGKGSYDGKITISSYGEEAVVELDNIKVENEKKGYVSGNIAFEIEEQKITLALEADEDSQTVSSDIVVEDVNYGKLTVDIAATSDNATEMPDKSAAYDMYGEDANFPQDYVEQEKMVEFAKSVLMNIGIEEIMADELAIEFGDSIYYVYDEDDYNYGWDDEEYEWDEEYDWDEEDFMEDSDIYWDEDFMEDSDIQWSGDADLEIDFDDLVIDESYEF